MGQDGSVALAGSADTEFQVIKLDADGNFVRRFKVLCHRCATLMTPRQ